MTPFDRGAEYYEALSNPAGRLEKEGPFLLGCLGQAPGSRVLDMACGTGLHAHFLADHGAEVTARDRSAGMIAHAARQRPHARITYEEGDMRSAAGGAWDLALCIGNSLALITDREGLRQVCEGVAGSLVPGGLWLLQLVNYHAPAARKPRHRVETRETPGGDLVAVKSLVPRQGQTYLSINYFVERGGRVETLSETAVLRHWDLEALRPMAEAAGLNLVARHGGFQEQPFDASESTDLVLVLEKPV